MPLVLAMEMPHITTIIILAIGAVLFLALAFCLFMLIVFSGSVSGAKKTLKKLSPDSQLLKSKNAAASAAPEKKDVKKDEKKDEKNTTPAKK